MLIPVVLIALVVIGAIDHRDAVELAAGQRGPDRLGEDLAAGIGR
jgi:hypothetical protein